MPVNQPCIKAQETNLQMCMDEKGLQLRSFAPATGDLTTEPTRNLIYWNILLSCTINMSYIYTYPLVILYHSILLSSSTTHIISLKSHCFVEMLCYHASLTWYISINLLFCGKIVLSYSTHMSYLYITHCFVEIVCYYLAPLISHLYTPIVLQHYVIY